jgi:urease accessory protein
VHSPPRNDPLPPPWDLADLRLLHLADSALPVGSLAHSFGIESLVSQGFLSVANLPGFFRVYLEEEGMVGAVFCREAWRLATANSPVFPSARWGDLNDRLSALKPARESRQASQSLGDNLLRAVFALGDFPQIKAAMEAMRDRDARPAGIHHSPAFGLVCGALGIDADRAVTAFLHQSIAGLVSACQRLMPLGQRGAMRLIWDLKPAMIQTAERGRACSIDDVFVCMPLLDWGSMHHPALSPRLFIS